MKALGVRPAPEGKHKEASVAGAERAGEGSRGKGV